MSSRPDSVAAVLDLARRLAEEFDTVPLPQVSRAVKAAEEATQLFGEAVAESLLTIEKIAREDLSALRDATQESSVLA